MLAKNIRAENNIVVMVRPEGESSAAVARPGRGSDHGNSEVENREHLH